jgi:ParB/RepB/Spo0J family partition protein
MLNSYPQLDPRAIVVKEGRQRKENVNDIDDIRQSISSIGIINPIVIRQENGISVLVAGERRLKAALSLDLATVPVRDFESLTEEEAEIIELEENVKRKELVWKDHVRAIGRIHFLYKKRNSGWRIEQTAEAVSLHHAYLRKILHVFDALDSGKIDRAESIEQAYNTLHRFSERKAESIVSDILNKGAVVFAPTPTAPTDNTITSTSSVKVAEGPGFAHMAYGNGNGSGNGTVFPAYTTLVPSQPQAVVTQTDPIIVANFHEWAETYVGPKFSLIHCDFPYGNYRGGESFGVMSMMETEDFYDNHEDIYWDLLTTLTTNLDKVMSYSAHLVFWFNMNFYSETVSRLRKVGLFVHDHPFVWHKTGGPGGIGVAPGTATTHPRRIYDTALFAVRGNRPMAKPGYNSYAAPTVGNKIHPSQKPEPMLRHFLSMLVDETTTMLDPTCGSGAALRAAEDLGAKYILGLELDPNYAKTANAKTVQARVLRQAGTMRKDTQSAELL